MSLCMRVIPYIYVIREEYVLMLKFGTGLVEFRDIV